jgi:hypothetical protein
MHSQAIFRGLTNFLKRRNLTIKQQSRNLFCEETGVLHSPHPDIPLPVANLAEDVVAVAAKRYGDATAIECVVTGEKVSFLGLWEEVKAYAQGKVDKGNGFLT